MLLLLRVRDFILIEELELELGPGFNVLTGETGAGKSIVVGAIQLVMGGRASPDVVRPGAAQAEVEALFDVQGAGALRRQIEEAGLGGDGQLVLRRVVQQGGRSRAYLNGRLCSAAELAGLASVLADVTSQHESVAIADPKRHIGYLDRFAALVVRRQKLGAEVEKLGELGRELAQLRERERDRGERESFLRYQLAAIEAVSPRPGEPEELGAERARLRHAERLRAAAARAAALLEGPAQDGEPSGPAALCDELGRLGSDLGAAAEIDPELRAWAEEIEGCWSRLREVAAAAARYAERAPADPQRLGAIEERLFAIEALLRRHGPRIEDALASAERICRELGELGSLESRLPELERERAQIYERAATLARALSAERRRAGARLGAAITAELAQLGMGEAQVLVEVAPASGEGADILVDGARLSRDGIDRVSFLIAPNKGSAPRPLGKIASGGELARALLALKRALGSFAHGEGDAPPSSPDGTAGRAAGIQIFDEVDAGIGGRTADRIGRSIADIARHRQVLCITHLAPIAAHAETHFVIDKLGAEDRVRSAVRRVVGRGRVDELARMLSGESAAGPSARTAAELLAEARAAPLSPAGDEVAPRRRRRG